MANNNIKQIIKQEYIKCAKDPVYFMKKYCFIQHPTRGRIQFNLFPFQEKVLTLLNKNDRNIILKSRQLGISTLSAGISLWMMVFQKDKSILVVATKQDTAKNLVTKVKFMYDQLFIDASGSWVRRAAQLIANKPLLPPDRGGGLPIAIEHSFDFTNDQHGDTYTTLVEQND